MKKVNRLLITFKGQKQFIIGVSYDGRKISEANQRVQVLHLENGQKILPAHFKYGLCKTDMSYFYWLLALHYSGSSFDLVPRSNPLLRSVKKSPAWVGGTYAIPVKYATPVKV